ncbi:hypothetical protein [Sutcliffiella sp. NC1]|uniref:hypothetical protein n=1 Tax=Sutcliffiella sp. NC1 TaxID=3004096 RepID=UPI0022DE932E|nr:hypothetical protein [Sutcliffiella sp. NC1]WBL13531.1 hypothetical protein O1A01_16610 [Sutcliffiella sp. NC1]
MDRLKQMEKVEVVEQLSVLFFFVFILALNWYIIKKMKGKKQFILSGVAIMLLLTPFIYFSSAITIGVLVGDGFAGGAGGLLFGLITFINGAAYLVKGLIQKT